MTAPIILLVSLFLPAAQAAPCGPHTIPCDAQPASMAWVMFGSGISVNTQTGEVRVPKGLPLDKASKQFWNAVAGVAATRLPFPEEKP